MIIAFLLAAGKSKRFGKDKLLAPVLGKPILYYSLQTLHDHPEINEVHLVVSAEIKKEVEKMVKLFHFPKVKKIILGGSERQQSLEKGLAGLKSKNDDIIIVHNGANPLLTAAEISEVIRGTKRYGAAAVGRKVVDTIKEIENGHITKTHPREKLVAMQTPQAAKAGILKNALNKAKKAHKLFTDETSLLEFSGYKSKHILASPANFKITTLHDYEHLKIIMGDTPPNFLVGLGQDSHEFEKNKKGLWLGGVLLKSEPKLKADSDGDVILHALCNAISQALGAGSLGTFATPIFKEKNITDSKKYLKIVLQKMLKKNYQLNNIGIMVEGKKPAIDQISHQLKTALSALTQLPEAKIGIIATTGKNLTSFGQGKGLQCFAIVSLIKN